MPSDAHEGRRGDKDNVAVTDVPCVASKQSAAGKHALQTAASASRGLPFVQRPPYLLSRVFFRHVPFVVDTYQYSQILVSTTKRRFTKRKSKSHLTKSRNQLTLVELVRVKLCHSLLLAASRRLSPTSPSSFCTAQQASRH